MIVPGVPVRAEADLVIQRSDATVDPVASVILLPVLVSPVVVNIPVKVDDTQIIARFVISSPHVIVSKTVPVMTIIPVCPASNVPISRV